MILPTKENVEARGGQWWAEFAWPIALGDEEAYWSFKAKEPCHRYETHIGDTVLIYSLPTRSAWQAPLPKGTPHIIRFLKDEEGYVCGGELLTAEEVHAYHELKYGKKVGPPKRRSA